MHDIVYSAKLRMASRYNKALIRAIVLLIVIQFLSSGLFLHGLSAYSATQTVTVGVHPSGVVYDSGKDEIFVTNSGENTVSVISDTTNTVVATVVVGANPFGLAYDSNRGEIFVANYGSGTVSVISDSNNTVVATVKVESFHLG